MDRLIGDSQRSWLYTFKVSQAEAQEFVDSITRLYNWPRVTVVFTGHENKRRYGLCKRKDLTIFCSILGQNLGTVIHELAHIPKPVPPDTSHGRMFKYWHRKLSDGLV